MRGGANKAGDDSACIAEAIFTPQSRLAPEHMTHASAQHVQGQSRVPRSLKSSFKWTILLIFIYICPWKSEIINNTVMVENASSSQLLFLSPGFSTY